MLLLNAKRNFDSPASVERPHEGLSLGTSMNTNSSSLNFADKSLIFDRELVSTLTSKNKSPLAIKCETNFSERLIKEK